MRALYFVLACLLAVAIAAPTLAIDFSASPETLAEQKQSWVERIRNDQHAVVRANQRHGEALAAYQRMKVRRRIRGDKRASVVDDLATSEQSLNDAEVALESTLHAARRAGVPPGWFREAAAGDPAARAPGSR